MKQDKYILRIKKNEEIVSSILDFCKKNEIDSAWISGLGSGRDFVLAYYNVDTKKYQEKKVAGVFEITSLIGNIGKLDNKLTAHLHVVFSDEFMKPSSGHLTSATVAATCEIMIEPLEYKIVRKHDPEIGLNLIVD